MNVIVPNPTKFIIHQGPGRFCPDLTAGLPANATLVGVATLDPAPFAQVIWHKRGEPKIRTQDVPRVLAGYLSGMQQLVHYLDRYSGGRA